MLEGRRQTTVHLAVALVLAAGAPDAGQGQTPTPALTAEPAHVTVIGTDYAFIQLPAELRAGPTLFAFENHGTKRHEMSIALLKPGIAVESLVAGGESASVSSRAVSDSIIGLLIARPGEQSGGQLYAKLVVGRTYVVICTLRDTPDAHRHADLGMVGSFRVY